MYNLNNPIVHIIMDDKRANVFAVHPVLHVFFVVDMVIALITCSELIIKLPSLSRTKCDVNSLHKHTILGRRDSET